MNRRDLILAVEAVLLFYWFVFVFTASLVLSIRGALGETTTAIFLVSTTSVVLGVIYLREVFQELYSKRVAKKFIPEIASLCFIVAGTLMLALTQETRSFVDGLLATSLIITAVNFHFIHLCKASTSRPETS